MNVALATCSGSHVGKADEAPLREALTSAGAAVADVRWDDPATDWSAYDACVLRTTWDYQDRLPAFLAWADAAARVTTLFNPLHVVRWNTEKTYLRELIELDLPVAPTEFLRAGEPVDLGAVVGARGWRRAFIKPVVGACARETLPFDADPDGLARAQAHADRLLPDEGLLLQPFLPAVLTEGEYSVIFIGGRLTHAVRKIPVAGDYRVMDEFGARDELAELPAPDLALAARVRQACEARLELDRPLLYARIDLLRDLDGRLVVNEVELVEPSLFFGRCPAAATALAAEVVARLGASA